MDTVSVEVLILEIPVENTLSVLPIIVELESLVSVILDAEIVERDRVLRRKVE